MTSPTDLTSTIPDTHVNNISDNNSSNLPFNHERLRKSLALSAPYTAFWTLLNTGLFQAGQAMSLLSSAVLLPIAGGFLMSSIYEYERRKTYMNDNGIKDERLIPPDEAHKIQNHAAGMAFQMMLPYMVAQVAMHFVLADLAKELTAGAVFAGAPLEAQMVTMLIGGLVFGAAMAAFEAIRAYNNNENLTSKEAMTKFGKLFVIGLFTGLFAQFTALIPGLNHAHGAGMPGWTATSFAVMGQLLTFTVGFAALIHVKEPDLVEALRADPLKEAPVQSLETHCYSNLLSKVKNGAKNLVNPAPDLKTNNKTQNNRVVNF